MNYANKDEDAGTQITTKPAPKETSLQRIRKSYAKREAEMREQSTTFFLASRISHNTELFIPCYDNNQGYDDTVGFSLSRLREYLEPLFLQVKLPKDCTGIALSSSNARLLANILLGYADAQEAKEIEGDD